ncbi:molybdopterin-dependent oxidoreductase [Ramlibacter tataouinensis]|uniref:Formate dehydrogenase (Formate-hydrogen-lyase-linked, selenocysteine-containing polypeptide)-like protein n=1 Tax=Ramlibacter tataouinensis (strain ATCC BAA-407 / DSM 14655 / LMG 21543 / TTB310) TaxID=365046 RepID=F5XWM5_RAMTT|nr:molybdopterin-dependent oxidoreductase [Ramlibacter tataouinensis]AEG94169.1 formate dehydrogenase (Formate-hydrogen-lyase-linked, selenocysteine-containing polypeptide)-like protein [Ramlibacter tataouinensis TTB310]
MKSPDLPLVSFKLDGAEVQALQGETILQAARRVGVEIPHLCWADGLRPDGNCRACVVEVAGERVLAPSCCRAVAPGLEVQARSERALKSQKMVLELLLADLPERGHKWNDEAGAQPHGELSEWAARLRVAPRPALKALRRSQPAPDLSHPAMAVNLDACIQCTRCVRACREEQVNDVIGYAGRGAASRIVFDLGDAMGESTCVACGECVQACPTGALMPKTLVGSQQVDQEVPSVCPFCGVGCQITYKVRDNRIVGVDGRDGPANHGRLCVKGRFGFDYAHHPQRLTKPLIRRPGVSKDPNSLLLPGRARVGAGAGQEGAPAIGDVFREATWEEALDFAAGRLKALRGTHGPKSLAGFGSAKGTNEEAYLFQKLVRTGFGSNNVDHCTRLCHASSVAALLEGVGSGAVSNPVADVAQAELVIVIGSNPTANHPVAATWMKNAARQGTRIVLADPRITELGRHAWRTLQFKPDTDVALLNAMIHTLIEEGLADREFIAQRASNFEALKESVAGFAPEAMEAVCGVPAGRIREVARAFASAKSAMILWGMGVSQHVHGTDNARCLIALCTVAGQIGKPGSGLHPLRGQNNVQGASDAGLIPMMFPNYQRVGSPEAHAWFQDFWGARLDPQPGYTVVEILHQALAPDTDPHKVRGMYVMGENPAMSDPDLNHAREALAALEHLVVQDIFMTETAWLADVVLPATAWPEKTGTVTNTDRMVQLGRQAIDAPGDAKPDLWLIQQIAGRMGLNWHYEGGHAGVAAVYEEMRQAMHGAIAGISWQRLEREGSVTYPCLSEDDPGQPIVFTERFPTPDGRVRLVPAQLVAADERPDGEFPLVLITGRQLEHWHTGSMTRRSAVLDAIEPVATASVNGRELERLGLAAGQPVRLQSRRGELTCHLRRDDGTPDGAVFMPFAYSEAAANLLTNAALDPFGKIPEFKYCAVRISA